jgi:pectate lyase
MNSTGIFARSRWRPSWTTPASGDKSASAWTTTATFPKTLSYTYEAVSPQCLKDKLPSYAGVGKNGAQLTPLVCGGSALVVP